MAEMDNNGIRILASIILFGLTLLTGTLPVHLFEFFSRKSKSKEIIVPSSNEFTDNSFQLRSWLKKRITKDGIIQFLTQIGGGVLFYTAFVHMLPEIRENYEQYLNSNSTNGSSLDLDDDEVHEENSLPVVDLCACAGFFGIFLIEELMHSVLLKNHDHHHHHTSTKDKLMQNKQVIEKILSQQKYCKARHYSIHFDENGSKLKANDNENSCSSHSHDTLNETLPISSINQCGGYNSCSLTNVNCENQAHCSRDDSAIQIGSSIAAPNLPTQAETTDSVWTHLLACLLIILAFSCHAIFDGISIGVQESSTEIWQLLIAILSHKMLIAFILSFQIYEKCFQTIVNPTNPLAIPERRPIKRAKLILWGFSSLFAVMSPIGIFVAMTLNSSTDAPTESNLRVIILAAISAGTILYIVFVEIIDKSSSRTHITGLVQWMALVIGFGAMHLVSLIFKE